MKALIFVFLLVILTACGPGYSPEDTVKIRRLWMDSNYHVQEFVFPNGLVCIKIPYGLSCNWEKYNNP